MTAHRLASMQRYGNRHGHSGVVAYALADGAIAVRCGSGETDVYTADSAGAEGVATMQRLAKAGRGLSTSINQSVRDSDADKIGV